MLVAEKRDNGGMWITEIIDTTTGLVVETAHSLKKARARIEELNAVSTSRKSAPAVQDISDYDDDQYDGSNDYTGDNCDQAVKAAKGGKRAWQRHCGY